MALRKVECAFCSEIFETEKSAQIYCSVRCRRQAARKRARDEKPLRTFTCAWCGDAFLSQRKKKYCSVAHRLIANGRILPKPTEREKPKMTIEQIAKASREEGLSYGEYVKKYNL